MRDYLICLKSGEMSQLDKSNESNNNFCTFSVQNYLPNNFPKFPLRILNHPV